MNVVGFALAVAASDLASGAGFERQDAVADFLVNNRQRFHYSFEDWLG